MDAEAKEYLHDRLRDLLAEMNAGFDRLAPRAADPVATDGASLAELEDRILSLEERLRTVNVEVGFSGGRSDTFKSEMRHRVRSLEARMSAIEHRLTAQERLTGPPLRETSSVHRHP